MDVAAKCSLRRRCCWLYTYVRVRVIVRVGRQDGIQKMQQTRQQTNEGSRLERAPDKTKQQTK